MESAVKCDDCHHWSTTGKPRDLKHFADLVPSVPSIPFIFSAKLHFASSTFANIMVKLWESADV